MTHALYHKRPSIYYGTLVWQLLRVNTATISHFYVYKYKKLLI